MLDFDDGFLHVLARGGGFDVAGCAVLVAQHVYSVADLLAWWNVERDEFGVAAFFASQRVQCFSQAEQFQAGFFGGAQLFSLISILTTNYVVTNQIKLPQRKKPYATLRLWHPSKTP